MYTSSFLMDKSTQRQASVSSVMDPKLEASYFLLTHGPPPPFPNYSPFMMVSSHPHSTLSKRETAPSWPHQPSHHLCLVLLLKLCWDLPRPLLTQHHCLRLMCLPTPRISPTAWSHVCSRNWGCHVAASPHLQEQRLVDVNDRGSSPLSCFCLQRWDPYSPRNSLFHL